MRRDRSGRASSEPWTGEITLLSHSYGFHVPLHVYFRHRAMSHRRQSVLTSRIQTRMVRLARGPARHSLGRVPPPATNQQLLHWPPKQPAPRLFRPVVFLPAAGPPCGSPGQQHLPPTAALCLCAVPPHLGCRCRCRFGPAAGEPDDDATTRADARTSCHPRLLSWLAQLTCSAGAYPFPRSHFYYYMVE